jgi:hypothetical protein
MDNNVQLQFLAGDICMKLKTVSMEEFEQALLCVLGPWSDYDRYTYLEYPPFYGKYCNRFYVQKFWEYFTVQEAYSVTQHVGLFITVFTVQGCDPQKVIERLLDQFHTLHQQRFDLKRNGDSEYDATTRKRKNV